MDFHLPELGEGVYEAELARWLVKEGDTVKRGQGLLEVLTDKATMEVPAPFAGTINSIAGEVGQRLKVGDVVLTYTAVGGSDAVPAPVAKRAESLVATASATPVGAAVAGNGSPAIAVASTA